MRLIGLGILLIVAGCSNTAGPELIKGDYYFTGGADCAFRSPHQSERKILCYNGKHQATSVRTPMTAEQMQMYAAHQQVAVAQVYQPQLIQPNVYHPMVIPQVTPINQTGQVRCLSTGFYTSCR